jgi:hypothetical protein
VTAFQWILLGLLGAVLLLAWCAVTILSRESKQWRECASGLARCVRTLDAWPVVERGEHGMMIGGRGADMQVAYAGDDGRHYASIPIPPAVAVIGRGPALDRWSAEASAWLQRHDALLDPEDGR